MNRDYDAIAQELVDLGNACQAQGMPKEQVEGAIKAGLLSYELKPGEMMKVARLLMKKRKAGSI